MLALPVGLSTVLSACGGSGANSGSETGGAAEPPREPVELTVYDAGIQGNYDKFMQNYGSYAAKKYPHISFKYVDSKTVPVANLAATQTSVDLYYTTIGVYPSLIDAGYTGYDLSPLVKKYGLELGRFDEPSLDMLRRANGGTLNALPATIISHVLTYNKDLFDKFGQPYLKDGMTWDDVYQVARNLTRSDGGVQYMGIGFQQLNPYLQFNPYGQDMWDPKTAKATLDGGKWPGIFKTMSSFFAIPGNPYMAGGPAGDAFLKERRMAMWLNYNSQFSGDATIPADFNFDVVKVPSFTDMPGVGSGPQPLFFGVSATSKHKDEAFLALAEMLADQAQTNRARLGTVPTVRLNGIDAILHVDNPKMKGKNVKALMPDRYGPATVPSPTGVDVRSFVVKAFESVATGQADINTALRQANEDVNKKLAEAGVAPSR